MEEFLKIDWHQPLNDIIDPVFVSDERLKNESIIYRMLDGQLENPFKDLELEEGKVKATRSTRSVSESSENKKSARTKRNVEEVANNASPQELKVAKRMKSTNKVSTPSSEETTDQSDGKTSIAAKNTSIEEVVNEEVESSRALVCYDEDFLDIQDTATSEKPETDGKNVPRKYVPGLRKCPLKFPRPSALTAQQHAIGLQILVQFSGTNKPQMTHEDREKLCTYTQLLPKIQKEQEIFVELAKKHWNGKSLQVFYDEDVNEHWSKKRQILESLPANYTEVGNIPIVDEKKFSVEHSSTCATIGTVRRVIVPTLSRPFMIVKKDENQSAFSFNDEEGNHKLPVSQDPLAKRLALENQADLVISSSGIKCLMSNLNLSDPNYWTVPVSVEQGSSKNVVFVDKPLPPIALTAPQKNTWAVKHILKSRFVHAKFKGQSTGEKSTENDVASETDTSFDDVKVPPKTQVTYNLFTINPNEESQSELMKNNLKKTYKILVRSKIDGFEKQNKDSMQPVIVTPKLEHQVAIGAESVTLYEAAAQWASVFFNPSVTLIRARIGESNGETLQVERRTAKSINNELQRLHNVKGENGFALLYNVANKLSSAVCGRYLLRHAPRNTGFVNIFKESTKIGKNTTELKSLFNEGFCLTIPNAPWIPIDKTLVTPMLQQFNRMPAMFYPSRGPNKNSPQVNKKKKKKAAKNASKSKDC